MSKNLKNQEKEALSPENQVVDLKSIEQATQKSDSEGVTAGITARPEESLKIELSEQKDASHLVKLPVDQNYTGNYDFKTFKANLSYKKLQDGEYQSLLKNVFLGNDGLLRLNYFTHSVNDGSGDKEWLSKNKHRTILIYLTVINEGPRKIVNKGMILKNLFHDHKNCNCLALVKSAIILFPHSYRIMSNCPFVLDHYNIKK